jgi:glycosyltransferase involved in cell wall biosynthesis
MRIGILAPPWIPVPPPAYGGIEEVVDVLACGLADLGHEVVLAAHPDSTCRVERIPVGLASTGQIGNKDDELQHAARSYGVFEDLQLDIVHDHTLAGPVYYGRPAGMPVVTTAHGPFTGEMLRHFLSLPSDVGVVAISHHQARTAGAVDIARVIHHGIDAKHILPGSGTGGYLAFLGRMARDKGVREAIEVARLAGMPLRIAAKMREAEEREYFKDAIEPLLDARIEYVGEVGTDEKFDLLRSAVAMVNPLRWPEPFGMVMIEAMAVGTPVLATPKGSAPELIEDGVSGFLRTTVAGLVAAIPLLDGVNRSQVRAHVIRHFSKEQMALNYSDYFRSVVGDSDNDQVFDGSAAAL